MQDWKEKMNQEIYLYSISNKKTDRMQAISHLGRAHILSQFSVFSHLTVHFKMLNFALKTLDVKEIYGQVLRIIVTIPGHLFGKVPWGNTGWTSVKLTERLPVPQDLKHFFESTL